MIKQLGEDSAKLFTYEVLGIRTTNTHDKTGAHECAADLSIIASTTGKNKEIPITYTVELTDNGEEFYVEASGL
ncbi:hypothetical protein [Pseudoalteromonas sp. S16_S37]|uniref:hypothetical protein n=1 Tax=Pseudoalteromonas sp. S16_S37 TaxID=2720228 RepID=UPI0016819F8E|nr:hypothetical protein [Pseudoalteromonas sp. S16_S37]MBD1584170.1 hypothetical protein [Pseudoalteromonas sp. S16_S37]